MNDTQPTIYIAGPMRGIPMYNRASFEVAQRLLTEDGWTVYNPHQMDKDAGFDLSAVVNEWLATDDSKNLSSHWHDCERWIEVGGKFNLHDAICRDLEVVLDVDAVYMLNGWENSTGARAEHAVAVWAKKRIIYQ